MPNHVINEIVFDNVNWFRRRKILKKVVKNKHVDFEILVPAPINIWNGNTGRNHEETFPGTHLDWARNNWGTKWNAYESEIIKFSNTLTIRFKTAWSPPYGWIIALFNYFQLPFSLLWMSEGHDKAFYEAYDPGADEYDSEQWIKNEADEIQTRYAHKLLWGVEEFEDEEAV